MNAPKFTFKKNPASGLAQVAKPYGYGTDVKLRGKTVGTIRPPNAQALSQDWRAAVMVEKSSPGVPDDGNPNCSWRWITFRTQFSSEEQAREWLRAHAAEIVSRYALRYSED